MTPEKDIRNDKWFSSGANVIKNHLQKAWCQNIYPAPSYDFFLADINWQKLQHFMATFQLTRF